jgi:hypothetical protein
MSLTPLEEYFFREDRQAYPWSFFVRLDFVGDVHRETAEKSLSNCMGRHPLLSSVVRCEDGRLVWQPVDKAMPIVRWTTAQAETAYLPAARLDVREEIGVRVHFAVGQESTRLIFQFHHASCDARGALAFIGDWLAEYGRAMGDGVDYGTPHIYDPALLDRRDCPGPAVTKPAEVLRVRWAGLLRAARFFMYAPAVLVDYRPAGDDDATPPGYPAARNYRFDEVASSEIRSAARRRGATVNDLLCCDLFLAIQAFRREMGQRPNAWLRLAVPVDLRTQTHRRMSAANLTGLVFLTRHAIACRNPAALLQGIHEEMCQVKAWRLARTFLRGLQIRRHLPGGIAHRVHGSKCQATATMTNVGEIFAGSQLPRKDGRLVAGNLLLESADFLAPIRPLTCVSLSACTYAGRLSLNLHYDPHGLSEGSAIRLFDTLLGQVRSEAGQFMRRKA